MSYYGVLSSNAKNAKSISSFCYENRDDARVLISMLEIISLSTSYFSSTKFALADSSYICFEGPNPVQQHKRVSLVYTN